MREFADRLKRLARRIGRRRFDHRAAQEYELRYSEHWLKDNFESIDSRLAEAKRNRERWPGPREQIISDFFAGDRSLWDEFVLYVEDRTCLEIGAGPCGLVPLWWWVKHRIIIDPLIKEYKRTCLELFTRTWHDDDIELYPQAAEDFIPQLSSAVDGAIICRNTLDHTAQPLLVLQNIARYAKPGCYLLLWTDLWHLQGHTTGHRNITRDQKAFGKRVRSLGFEVLYSFSDVRRDSSTVEYGCRAVKGTCGKTGND